MVRFGSKVRIYLNELEVDRCVLVISERKKNIGALYDCSPSAVVVFFRKEGLGFMCVCIYLMFEYVRPQSIYTWLDIFPWAALFSFLSLAFALFEKGRIAGNGVTKLIFLYGFVVILSSVFAVWPQVAFGNLNHYWQWVVIFYFITVLVNTKERFFVFMLMYLLFNFKMSQHAFLTWATRGFSFAGWGVAGSPGWFTNSGELGIQMTIFLPLALMFILALRVRWGGIKRTFFYMMVISSLGTIIASSSRGAILGVLASAFWQLKKTKYFVRTLLLLFLVGSVGYVITPPEFKERIESSGTDNTSMHRLDRWEKGLDAVLDYPFLGVGHKNWDQYFRRYSDHGIKGSAKIHNIFMESLTEHGFLGLSVFLLLIFNMFLLNMKTRSLLKGDKARFSVYMANGLDLGLIGMLISGSFVTVLYYPYVWIHAAFVVALYNSTYKEKEALEQESIGHGISFK